MKIICRYSALFLLFSWCSAVLAAAQMNELQKIYYHRTDVPQRRNIDLELATVVLYFSAHSDFKKTELQHDSKRIVLKYMFPNTVVNSSEARTLAQELQKKIQQSAQGMYDAKLYELENPSRIELVISYDPTKIIFDHDTFDAIKFQKGIAFHFYDKQLIERMKASFNGGNILQTASLNKKPLVIIDPGHGGKDSGTLGFFNIPEKEITLAVADKAIKTLTKKGFKAVSTRDKDVFVGLDERTLLANNAMRPCIFISLHGNHASSKEVSGLETYCLKKELFKKDDASLQTCIDVVDQYKDSLCKESQRLAKMVHTNILQHVRKIDAQVPDRLVKHAVSQVLLGATVPSILVEMDFLSNEHKAKLLARADYQQAIANGITQGVLQYLG